MLDTEAIGAVTELLKNPASTPAEIEKAEAELNGIVENIRFTSYEEALQLIGDLNAVATMTGGNAAISGLAKGVEMKMIDVLTQDLEEKVFDDGSDEPSDDDNDADTDDDDEDNYAIDDKKKDRLAVMFAAASTFGKRVTKLDSAHRTDLLLDVAENDAFPINVRQAAVEGAGARIAATDNEEMRDAQKDRLVAVGSETSHRSLRQKVIDVLSVIELKHPVFNRKTKELQEVL